MGYKRRRKSTSGFKKYCDIQLRSVRSASKAGTRSKAAKRWQECLSKKGIKTGLGKPKKKS